MRLKRIALINTTLGDPNDPSGALRPAWFDTSKASGLWIVDALVFTGPRDLAAYAERLRADAAAGAQPLLRFYTVCVRRPRAPHAPPARRRLRRGGTLP